MIGDIKKIDDSNKAFKCSLCYKDLKGKMKSSLPIFFIPGAYILYSCARSAYENPFSNQNHDRKIKANGSICKKCKRLAILTIIAIYLMLFGTLGWAIVDKLT